MKIDYINIGCGNKYHKDWTNIDMKSNSPDVIQYNLLKGFPFSDESFSVVYHSQVLEHIPKEKAFSFLSECYRILKKEGCIRVVVPDLENIVDEYKRFLDENLENPNAKSKANYDWIMLELFDQTVRNYSGGQMAEYLMQEKVLNEKYVIDRIGFVGRDIRNTYLQQKNKSISSVSKYKIEKPFYRNILGALKAKILSSTFLNRIGLLEYRIGKFRLGGEVHMWMYDRYSLSRILSSVGFKDIQIKNPYESNIPKWEDYELDVKDGLAFDPTSLFIEAKK